MGRLEAAVAALLGLSTYTQAPRSTSVSAETEKQIRESMGGQMAMPSTTRLRWYLADLESAIQNADQGNLRAAAQIWSAAKRDGALTGVLGTLTGGVVGLPRRWTGNPDIVNDLEGRDGVLSVYENMCPTAELKAMVDDDSGLGYSVGELLPVEGRDYPVLCRLDPQFATYRWSENRWYYQSVAGAMPITPGDGRWVLHIGGGRVAPWKAGLWYSVGQSWINKQHAGLHKSNWEAKLANPARVAVSPQGASEEQAQSWFQAVMGWGINTVFGLKPGYDVRLLESNGRGYECFESTISQSEREYIIAIAGQLVTTDGGAGFSNSDVHRSIRADIIRGKADAIAHTLNTQVFPAFVVNRYGVDALKATAALELDTKPPKDMKASADAMKGFGDALDTANRALAPYGLRVDARELSTQFGVPLLKSDDTASEGLLEMLQ